MVKKTQELKDMNRGRLITLLDQHTTQVGVATYLGVSRQYIGQLLAKHGIKLVKKITLAK